MQSEPAQAGPPKWLRNFLLKENTGQSAFQHQSKKFPILSLGRKGRLREEGVPRVPHLARHLQPLRGERPDSRQKKVRGKMPREAGRLDTRAGADALCRASQGLKAGKSCADAGKGLGYRCGAVLLLNLTEKRCSKPHRSFP